MDKTVAIFKKNKFQDIHVSLREYKGNQLFDIRTWTMVQGSDDKVPTARGVALNIKLLSNLKEALGKVEEVLKEKE